MIKDTIVDGFHNAPHRSLYHALGLTDEEQARIDDFYARRAEDVLAYYKRVHADVPARMAERQAKAMERIAAMR